VIRSGARILVDQLVVHGVDTAFCVPGESYIAVLDALRDAPIRLVVARHEAGAANMAEAYGKLTGRPGICFVTRAPGATHAATGVYTAFQDSTPLILFVGQVPLEHRGREAFQELDYGDAFAAMTKLAIEVEGAGQFP
jgi:acetolactate synthase I/II/III large subunit